MVSKLVALPADYRILSIHYGLEGRVMPDERQLADWRTYAAEEEGIDLIVGHHPHVAQGVELNGKSLIFYGLGNFLHPGTAEMTRFGLCRDYGLMAKVHLARIDGTWRVEAIEAIPLTNTQMRPARFAPRKPRSASMRSIISRQGSMTARTLRACASPRRPMARDFIAPMAPPRLAASSPRYARAGSRR